MRVLLSALSSIVLLLSVGIASAHNNPTFREDLLATIEVAAPTDGESAASDVFSLSWPKKTVQLIWRVVADQPSSITFDVSQKGEVVVEQLSHDASSKRLEGDDFSITGVKASAPFQIEIYAKVLDRKKK